MSFHGKCIRGRFWSESEINFLRKNYKKFSIKDLGNKLNRSKDSVAKKMGRLNLYNSLWSKAEDIFLKENYKTMTNRDMAKKLNRSFDSVNHRLSERNLIKSPEDKSNLTIGLKRNYVRGKNHPKWEGGKSFYKGKRNIYPTKEWAKIRKKIIKRDEACNICGSKDKLIVHHKKFYREGGSNNSDNLITLCTRCHAKIHTLERFYRNNHVYRTYEQLVPQIRKKLGIILP